MSVNLYNADCLDVLRKLESGSVDAVVTDPPYGISYVNTKGKGVLNDERPFIWWLFDAFRITKEGGCLICFCRWDVQEAFRFAIETAGYRLKSQVIWDRKVGGMGDLKAGFSPMHDVIWFGVKGRFEFPAKRPNSVVSVQRLMSNQVHPTQKPVELMRHLVDSVVPAGGTVVDPFMGSGSTGIACSEGGYNFIGIEADAGHFETASSRIPH